MKYPPLSCRATASSGSVPGSSRPASASFCAAIAAIHLGGRPAVGDDTPRVEAHLLDPAGGPWTPPPGLPEYGWACTLRLVGRIRDIARFEGLDALTAQIARDCERARAIVTPVLATPAPIPPAAAPAPEPA